MPRETARLVRHGCCASKRPWPLIEITQLLARRSQRALISRNGWNVQDPVQAQVTSLNLLDISGCSEVQPHGDNNCSHRDCT